MLCHSLFRQIENWYQIWRKHFLFWWYFQNESTMSAKLFMTPMRNIVLCMELFCGQIVQNAITQPPKSVFIAQIVATDMK